LARFSPFKKTTNSAITYVEVPDFKKERYHLCVLIAHYANNTKKEFVARVLQNKRGWAVSCKEVTVKVIETNGSSQFV
tara:strand:+ start:1448 stop:1681 length:234 start_codon:yes stop_codon:yes gene_type:complete